MHSRWVLYDPETEHGHMERANLLQLETGTRYKIACARLGSSGEASANDTSGLWRVILMHGGCLASIHSTLLFFVHFNHRFIGMLMTDDFFGEKSPYF